MVHQCIHDSKVSLEVVSRQMPDEQEWMREEQPQVTTRDGTRPEETLEEWFSNLLGRQRPEELTGKAPEPVEGGSSTYHPSHLENDKSRMEGESPLLEPEEESLEEQARADYNSSNDGLLESVMIKPYFSGDPETKKKRPVPVIFKRSGENSSSG